MRNVLLVLTIALVVLGGVLSYFGYNESLQASTVTNTESFTATSTRVITSTIASTSTKLSVMMTTTTKSIIRDVIDLQAVPAEYCGVYKYREAALDPGPVHVSYVSSGTPVDFWLLDRDPTTVGELRSCHTVSYVFAVFQKSGSFAVPESDFTVDIPRSGVYYFTFMNRSKASSVSVTLNVDGGVYETEITQTNYYTQYSTLYSTEESPYVTQKLTLSSNPAGLGVLFFSGVGLLAAGIILAVIRPRITAPPVALKPPPTPMVIAPSPKPEARAPPPPPVQAPIVPEKKFCISCGASIPPLAKFCNTCGATQAESAAALEADEARVLELLRKLEEAHASGRVSDETYKVLRRDYESRLSRREG